MTETFARRPSVAAVLPETPYVGLVPYSEDDAAFFFGRNAEKAVVIANLRAARLTLVYGPSGVGKTSLLQAGVVHDLRAQVALNAAADGARAPFAVAVFRNWRDEPLAGLMESIRSSVLEAAPGEALEPWRPGRSVVDTLRAWTAHARRLLVVLDQFEDYFLYHPAEGGEGTFDAAFPEIVNDPNLRVHVLVSIREDAWASLDRFEGRIPQLFANYLRVEHLDRDGGRDAIEGPIAEYNSRLPRDAEAFTVDADLVAAVLDAAAAASDEGASGPAAAGDAIETPFLQLVMERLWRATAGAGGRALTLATLERAGGARRIVETHLVNALGALDPADQAVAAEAFRYLVTRSRRRVAQSLPDLAEWLGRPEDAVAPVLEKLTTGESGRILRPVPAPPGREADGARYELFHDVLAEPILDWRRQFEAERGREAEARRQRVVRRRLVAALVVVLALAGAFGTLALLAVRESHRAQRERASALASRAIREAAIDPLAGLVLAMHAMQTRDTPEARSALTATLRAADDVRAVLRGHTDEVERASFSPDGRLVVTAGDDGTARVWDAATGRAVHVLRAGPGAVLAARFSRDGSRVVTGNEDGTVRVWSAAGKPLSTVRPYDAPELGPDLSSDGSLLLVGSSDGDGRSSVFVWDVARRRAVRVLRVGTSLTSAALSRDGHELLAAGDDGTVRIWNLRGRRAPRVLRVPGGAVTVASFSPGGGRVGLATDDFAATVWNLRTGRRLVLRGHTSPIKSIDWSNDGRYVLTSGDNTARIWDASTGKAVTILRGHGDFVLDASFSPDDRRVVTASADTTARVWEVRPVGGQVLLSGHRDRVYDAAFSPDGHRVVTASRDDTARVWDARSGKPLRTLRAPADVLAAAFLPGGADVVTAGVAGVQRWGPSGGARLVSSIPARSVDVRGDGALLVAGLYGTARIWNGRGWRSLRAAGIASAQFSADGAEVVTAGEDGVETWNARTLEPIRRLKYAARVLYFASFSPDGKLIATASADQTARLWDAATGKQVRVLRGHAGSVTSARFSPDGRLLVTSSKDDTVRVWDVKTGAVRAIFTDHADVVWNAAFSRDGSRVVSASSDGTARIYPLTPIDELLRLARERLRASVTPEEERAIVAQP